MCSECKSLTLATDPRDNSKMTVWLPHNDDDLEAGHVWIGVTEDPEDGTDSVLETSIMLSIEEQGALISWIQDRRREREEGEN